MSEVDQRREFLPKSCDYLTNTWGNIKKVANLSTKCAGLCKGLWFIPSRFARYDEDRHYEWFDPEVHHDLAAVDGAFKKFKQYDAYKLYINSAAVNGAQHFPICQPAEFDHKGMIRASRITLGLAAKMWVKDRDLERGLRYKRWIHDKTALWGLNKDSSESYGDNFLKQFMSLTVTIDPDAIKYNSYGKIWNYTSRQNLLDGERSVKNCVIELWRGWSDSESPGVYSSRFKKVKWYFKIRGKWKHTIIFSQ